MTTEEQYQYQQKQREIRERKRKHNDELMQTLKRNGHEFVNYASYSECDNCGLTVYRNGLDLRFTKFVGRPEVAVEYSKEAVIKLKCAER